MKHSGRIESNQGRQAVADAKEAWRSAWRKACEHDGIDPNSSFVVFSDDNPYTRFITPALQNYNRTLEEYTSGGHSGLTMKGR